MNKRILVLCEKIVPAGGLLRFERLAQNSVLAEESYYLCPLGEKTRYAETDGLIKYCQIIDSTAAKKCNWDVTLIPGAAFSEKIIRDFEHFQQNNFGLRVQHILNDTSQKKRFLHVNRKFRPQLVIFNNNSWKSGSYTEFIADQFHHVVGGVDIGYFEFNPSRPYNKDIIITGLANKNPIPLIESLEYLPQNYKVKLFGPYTEKVFKFYKRYRVEGRLEFTGVLNLVDLKVLYNQSSVIVSTAERAGWANLGAEALAAGIPLVTTFFGAEEFAVDGKTALVLVGCRKKEIAEKIMKISTDARLRYRIISAGRKKIEKFDWVCYANRLHNLYSKDITAHYIHWPEKNLFGKWPLQERLNGLDKLSCRVQNKSVMEIGCAEGAVLHMFLEAGAEKVIGVDIDKERVVRANKICNRFENKIIFDYDLNNWDAFKADHGELFENKIDILLFLGIYHHLKAQVRKKILSQFLQITRKFCAIRTPQNIFLDDRLEQIFRDHGFEFEESTYNKDSNAGVLILYKRSE